jgi:hypothetical protein
MCEEEISGWDVGGLPKEIFPVKSTVDDAVDKVLDIGWL